MPKKRRVSTLLSKVDTLSTASEKEKRHKREKVYNTPNECWRDEDLPSNERLFIETRKCKDAAAYHDVECNEFDDFVSEMSAYTRRVAGSMVTKDYRKTMLNYYHRVSSDLIPAILSMSHMIGSIDILKTKLSESDKRFYRNIQLDKITNPDYWRGKRKPVGFDVWPDVFRFVNPGDNRQTKTRKRRVLRECLNRRITFMKDCVYACSDKILHRYLMMHLDFIVNLQILAVTIDA